MTKKFSVLMSLYCRESTSNFQQCFESIWHHQTVKPDQIVLVLDGALYSELYQMVDAFKAELGDTIMITKLDKNYGLGIALSEGLKHCKFELVARMDTDDIAIPGRFEKQLNHIESEHLDLSGGWVSEFEGTTDNVLSIRKVPSSHQEIVKFARWRNPFNHPTVMYRKQAILEVGSYQEFHGFEDYELWTRLIDANYQTGNIPEVLLHFRSGTTMFKRRRGLDYLKKEVRFQNALVKRGFISRYTWFVNLLVRCSVRLLPERVIQFVYGLLRS